MFFEAAQGLAWRIIFHQGTFSERVQVLFELAVGRQPGLREQQQMQDLFQTAIEQFQQSPEIARQWSGMGNDVSEEDWGTKSPPGTRSSFDREVTDPVSMAAWALMAQTMLNLDEFVMRE